MEPLLPALDNGWVTMLIGLFFITSIIGTIFPVIPGLSLVIVGAVLYGLAHGIEGAGIVLFVLIVLLAAVGIVSNLVLPSQRANKAGANVWSILLGVVCAIIGLFAIPIIGLPVGGALGIFLGEVIRGRSNQAAWDSTKETLIGLGISFIVQFLIACVCFALWLSWAVFA